MNGFPRTRPAWYLALAAVGCAADLWTKSWIFEELGPPGGRTWWLWPDLFGFQTSLNQGALFGIGQGQVWLFAICSVVALVGILIWLFWAGAAEDLVLTTALGVISAGILGNLYDRLGLWWSSDLSAYPQHAVRDWILMQYKTWVWPNYNLADAFLVCGAATMVLHAWRTPAPVERTAAENSAA